MNSTDECADRAEDEKLKKIHGRIKTLKQSRKLEEKYMLVEELLKRERKEGHQEGYDEGSQQMLKLVTQMTDDGKADQIPRLESDKTFCQEMLKKYNL